LVWAAPRALAVYVDLLSEGAGGTINGAVFAQGRTGAGSGNYIGFLRVRATGRDLIEEGYNTSARPFEFDEVGGGFTHDIQLGDLRETEYNGSRYVIFGIDINEDVGGSDQYLSLDQVRIFVSPTGNRTGFPDLGTEIWNLDAGDPTNTVFMDYSLAAGSGYADATFMLPASLLQGYSLSQYLYLYTEFGGSTASRPLPGGGTNSDWSRSDGFEEWALDQNYPAYTPEPGSLLLCLVGFAVLIGRRSGRRPAGAEPGR
jgi:hypothetical protein